MLTRLFRLLRIQSADAARRDVEQRNRRDFETTREVAKYQRSQFGTLLPTNDDAKAENERLDRKRGAAG